MGIRIYLLLVGRNSYLDCFLFIMRIALFDLAGYDYPGGCEKYFYNLAQYVTSSYESTFYGSRQYKRFMDYVYHILFGRSLDAVVYLARKVGTMRVFDVSFFVLLPFSPSYFRLRKSLLSQDIIYAKNEFQELGLLYWLLGKKAYSQRVIVGMHTPVFLSSHNHGLWEWIHMFQYGSHFYGRFLLHARKIHVLNTDYLALVRDRYGVSRNIACIPNPIEWKTSFVLSQEKSFTMVWVGRLTEQKGLDRFAKIISLLSQTPWFNDLRIVIAGDGEKRSMVESWVQRYPSVLSYQGFVTDMELLYQHTDVSLFTAYFDTFAHAVLEPQSFGIPVISYAIPGPNDIIENGKTGYLVSTEEEFVRAVETLYMLKKKTKRRFSSLRRYVFQATNKRFAKKKIFSELERMLIT